MHFRRSVLLGIASSVLATAEIVSVTPHTQFSSSIGVLGCKLANVDRIAFFPFPVDCNGMCFRLTNQGRSLTVLHIDQSGGAHDISYDAWNILGFGQSVAENPQMGGGIDMDMEPVGMDQCADLLPSGKLAFSAPTGTNQIVACPAGSFTRDNFELFNINTSTCTIGIDEPCTLDANSQPQCPSGVGQGAATPLQVSPPVLDYVFGTSQRVVAP